MIINAVVVYIEDILFLERYPGKLIARVPEGRSEHRESAFFCISIFESDDVAVGRISHFDVIEVGACGEINIICRGDIIVICAEQLYGDWQASALSAQQLFDGQALQPDRTQE